ncbi:MAG: phosphate transporter, inner rane subunit PstC [Xanthobacteraceae bacterium]|nr:phosphate transporter, inner rane subunit PstC [Xanthobacteraceae bacterium]
MAVTDSTRASGLPRVEISASFLARRRFIDWAMRVVLFCCAALSVLVTAGIVYVLLSESLKFFAEVSLLDFLTDTQWTPVFEDKHFGIMTLVSGTFMTSLIALLVAIPAGTVLAIYLSEFARPGLRETVKPFLELIAGVPTVAFGYFALLLLTPLFQTFIPGLAGFNLLVPGIVMGVMILPYIVSVSEDAMRAVPSALREGAMRSASPVSRPRSRWSSPALFRA